MESPCECGIEPPDSISNGVTTVICSLASTTSYFPSLSRLCVYWQTTAFINIAGSEARIQSLEDQFNPQYPQFPPDSSQKPFRGVGTPQLRQKMVTLLTLSGFPSEINGLRVVIPVWREIGGILDSDKTVCLLHNLQHAAGG